MTDALLFDAIIIGSGHAGCEAALVLSRLSFRTIVFTVSVDNIAYMPCNPHIGGSSKGHLVREIDALGGEMGRMIDKTFLQSRMLNRSKGPAVHSLRAQADKQAYSNGMRKILESEENITIKQAEVIELLCEDALSGDGTRTRKVCGVKTLSGICYEAPVVIICAGTYLKARCLTGEAITYTGPNGMPSANLLSGSLEREGIKLRRFKTGTPARMDGKTIAYDRMTPQYGDVPVIPFSFDTDPAAVQKEQEKCYLTWTNEKTHDIIRKSIHRSPMYSGVIEGIGPRYCPSIEDKVVRFADKDRHQVFIEPEGLYTNEMYVDGMSSSLPEDVQEEMYRTVPGLEDCRIVKAAYAIEYDCLCPGQLTLSLESRAVSGLFFAGQINGSSGYEEAAAQGFYAAANAVMKLRGEPPFIIRRSEGYIGVLVDDLVTKDNPEPYRMMTSRAEYRLLLRQDNADLRLREKGYRLGLISEDRYSVLCKKRDAIAAEIRRLKDTRIGNGALVRDFLASHESASLKTAVSLADLLRRPELSYTALREIDPLALSEDPADRVSREIIEQVEIDLRYEGYIARTLKQVEAFHRLEDMRISADIDYDAVKSLRTEARQQLIRMRPVSIGQASRLGGVNPADIQVLMVYIEAMRRDKTIREDKP